MGIFRGDVKGEQQAGQVCELLSTKASRRGGSPCSSVEVSVMGMERRGGPELSEALRQPELEGF